MSRQTKQDIEGYGLTGLVGGTALAFYLMLIF